ncbi:unnamed protein product, partial [Callosobruchus maculatus]
PAGLSVRTEWSADVRSPERVYGPVYLSVKTVQATGEESHIYMFVHPADLTHYHWSIQKERDRQDRTGVSTTFGSRYDPKK